MPGPSPQVPYDPVQTVAPTTQAPSDYQTVRSNPNQFGAQIGQSLQKTGSAFDQFGNQAVGVAVQQQGLLNEHAANMADMQLAVQGGKVYDQYKQLEGLNAASAKDKAVSDYMDVSNNIRNSLGNPAAQRAYDQIAARRMSYTIQDMNSYAADQTKAAYKTGNAASMNLSIDQASKPGVAFNPNQFGFELGNVRFQANAMFTSPDYGKYRNLTPTTNKDGTLSFDQSTPEGKVAQADYNDYINKATGQAWENRILTVANDPQQGDTANAVQMLEDNKGQIPAVTYAKLSNELKGPYRADQSRDVSKTSLSLADQGYNNSLSIATGSNDIDRVTNAFISQESGGKGSNLGQIQPNTWAEFAKPGEVITSPQDNTAVEKRMLQSYMTKYNGDIQRVAVANFSGPGNVAPEGSATPWVHDYTDKTGKSVSSYVSDMEQRLGEGQSGYQSKVDYYRANYDNIVADSGTRAAALHNDPTFIQQAQMQTRQILNDAISGQESKVRASQDSVIAAVQNPKSPITNIEDLDHSVDPQLKANWVNMQANVLGARDKMTSIIMGNSHANVPSYGTSFYNHYMDALDGKVSNPLDLAPYVQYSLGKDSPITNTGFSTIQKQLASQSTPQGQVWAKAQSTFFSTLYNSQIGPSSGHGDKMFSTFLQQALPQVQAAEASNKSPTESGLFDKSSPNYLGKVLDSVYAPSKRLADATERSESGINAGELGVGSAVHIDNITDPAEGLKILKSRITDAASQKRVIAYARARGWIQPEAPQVPLPE